MLGQRVGRHGGDNDMAQHAAQGNDDGIENVARERDPAFVHQNEQVAEIGQCGIADKDARRELIDFIERFERVVDDHDQRQDHKQAADAHDNEKQGVAGH